MQEANYSHVALQMFRNHGAMRTQESCETSQSTCVLLNVLASGETTGKKFTS